MFDESWAKELIGGARVAAMTESEDKNGESLCRFHKRKKMCFCTHDNPEVQESCKYHESSSGYLKRDTCAYWDTTDIGVVVNGYHHCKSPDAQVESYHTPQLQVDK